MFRNDVEFNGACAISPVQGKGLIYMEMIGGTPYLDYNDAIKVYSIIPGFHLPEEYKLKIRYYNSSGKPFKRKQDPSLVSIHAVIASIYNSSIAVSLREQICERLLSAPMVAIPVKK